MTIFLFSVSVAVSLFLLLLGLIRKRLKPQSQIHKRIRSLHGQQLQKIETGMHGKPKKLQDIPFIDRVLKPGVQSLERSIGRLAPKQLLQEVAQRLTMAGKAGEWTVTQFITTCLLGAAVMCGILYLMLEGKNYALIQKIMFLILGGFVGGFMPVASLNFMIRKRQQEIQLQLPEVLDLLCVSVQAGLSFDAALRKIVERMKGPFVDECRRLQDDVRMGMVRRTAMKNVASRCDIQDVSLFMTSLIQAERLGTSMGKTLKNQADNIRERRRQYVKAEAMKAPVKIIFPLVIFIFPALFVVALAPTLFNLVKSLK